MYYKTEKNNPDDSNIIDWLHDEVLCQILCSFHPEEILKTLKLVSRKFYSLCSDIYLWEQIFKACIAFNNLEGPFMEGWFKLLLAQTIYTKNQSFLNLIYRNLIVPNYQISKELVGNLALGDHKYTNRRPQSHWAAICNQLSEFEENKWPTIDTEDSCGNTELMLAAKYGHSQLVNFLLQNGAEVNVRQSPPCWPPVQSIENSALILASAGGHLDIVKALLEYGADVDYVNMHKETAIMKAFQRGHLEIGKLLLRRSTNINAINQSLIYAAIGGHLEGVKFLIREGGDVNTTVCVIPPLTHAAENGHDKVVEFLLEKGSIDKTIFYAGLSITALESAVDKGHLKVVNLLLKKETGVDTTTKSEQIPLTIAATKGDVSIAKLLLEEAADIYATNDQKDRALRAAINFNKLDIVQLLLLHDANLNSVNERGETPLLIAARARHLDIVTVLLEHGADINAANTRNQTALLIAADHKNLELIETLLKYNANINAANIDMHTTLLYLISYLLYLKFSLNTTNAHSQHEIEKKQRDLDHCRRLINVLLQKGADVNAASKSDTALTLLAAEGELETAKLLFTYRIDIDTNYNKTALIIAAEAGHLEMVKFLLEKGANVNASNENGNTALIMAAKMGHLEIVQSLVEKGANIDASNAYGNTALVESVDNSHVEIVKHLLNNGPNSEKSRALKCAMNNNHSELKQLLQVEVIKEATINYLEWRVSKACAHRFFGGRFNHWYHGTSGIKRAEKILKLINDSSDSLMDEVKEAVKQSSHRKHSYSRYLFDALEVPQSNTVNNESDEDFLKIKQAFLNDYDTTFLSI